KRFEEVKKLLKMHGGCSAGEKLANVDSFGNVHPCQFWGHLTLGNVREKKFSEIWLDNSNEFLKRLRNKPKYLKGKCGECRYKNLCGGCRIRAETAYGDLWQEDPACYL
ncbi:MAG: SPASM domain-containing protein, partial [Candidatus Methanofastidiosia archaeon]